MAKRGKQGETILQKKIIEFLNNSSGLGCKVSRIKNTATWNPNIGRFQAATTEIGIPDIIGCSASGRAIYIECKMLKPNGNASQRIPEHQAEYLKEMDKRGALVGVAYTIGDAYDIVADNPSEYPRLPRTYYYQGPLSKDRVKRVKKKVKDPFEGIIGLTEASPGQPNGECPDEGSKE